MSKEARIPQLCSNLLKTQELFWEFQRMDWLFGRGFDSIRICGLIADLPDARQIRPSVLRMAARGPFPKAFTDNKNETW